MHGELLIKRPWVSETDRCNVTATRIFPISRGWSDPSRRLHQVFLDSRTDGKAIIDIADKVILIRFSFPGQGLIFLLPKRPDGVRV